MGVFDLDFSRLRAAVDPDAIPLRGNEHRITRVAFDLFKLDEDKENLWQVQADDDGNEFLVRTYELPKDDSLQIKSEWSVLEDGKKASLTVAYRGMPIHRLVASDYGAHTQDEVRLLRDLVQAKLADNDFASRMLATLPESKRAALEVIFPKLATSPALPKVPMPTSNDPLEGILPLDVKKEFGIDPAQKPQPMSKEWERHPRTPGFMTADDGPPQTRYFSMTVDPDAVKSYMLAVLQNDMDKAFEEACTDEERYDILDRFCNDVKEFIQKQRKA